MKDVGQILKEKRQAMGKSLEEVSSALKVKYQFLKDIENNKNDPNDVYTFGYIKLYSKYVGLNLDMEDLSTASGMKTKNSFAHHQEEKVDVKEAPSGAPSIRVVIISIVVALISILSIFFFSNKTLDGSNISYIRKFERDSAKKTVVKGNNQTYFVNTHNDNSLVISALDSVDVIIFDSNSRLLKKIHMRVGESIPFPVVGSHATIVRFNVPDAIEIKSSHDDD